MQALWREVVAPLIQRLQPLKPWALIIGASSVLCIFLILRLYASLSVSIIGGLVFLILFLVRLMRALFGPIATVKLLRKAQILQALPLGLYCFAAFLNAHTVTSRYAPWFLLAGILLHIGIVRPYIKKLPHQEQ